MTKGSQKQGSLFNVGDLATHRETGRTRIVRHIRFSQEGEMLLGFGKYPTGFVFAKHYRQYGKKD